MTLRLAFLDPLTARIVLRGFLYLFQVTHQLQLLEKDFHSFH